MRYTGYQIDGRRGFIIATGGDVEPGTLACPLPRDCDGFEALAAVWARVDRRGHAPIIYVMLSGNRCAPLHILNGRLPCQRGRDGLWHLTNRQICDVAIYLDELGG